MKGKFIVFEGIDGSGKGTQMKNAAGFLFDTNKDFDIYMTREPTRDFKEIREKLASESDVSANAEWFAKTFVKDRENHLQKYILPALEKGTHVLCDRYKHSTLAYQTTQGMDFERLKEMHKGMLIPDLTLIFDCPARIAFERREQAGATDVFDKDLEFQEKLRQNYLKLKEKLAGEKIIIIDATRTPKEIFLEVKKEIKKIL